MSSDPISYEYADDILKDRIVLVTGASDGIGTEQVTNGVAVRMAVLYLLAGSQTPPEEVED